MNDSGGAPQQIRWSAQTHQGRVRRNNEDAYLCLRFDATELTYLGKEGESPLEDFEFLFAVSDGMGGENAGEFASRIVIQSVTDIISREFHQRRESKPNAEKERLLEFCQQIHKHARQVSRHYEECQGMGATLSLGWLQDQTIHIAHLGDSRIYHLPKDGKIAQLTEDHTVTGRLLRAGKISEREARQHPYRNQLEKSIGCQADPVEPQIISVPFQIGDRFVLCSDGITDGLWDTGIDKLIRTPPPYLDGLNPAQGLVKEAMEASGRDNLTAMVIEVE
ncbi:protein phosphatase 2C domain-containing protein [bacterium]|jgi:PPM family protein phosphatase|nr:protein phosphatase 2C domain-containing protein [Verrucomicrobiota bacterium]MDA7645573.1 protein phosphatase 2C domain-containing protein [bacterium]